MSIFDDTNSRPTACPRRMTAKRRLPHGATSYGPSPERTAKHIVFPDHDPFMHATQSPREFCKPPTNSVNRHRESSTKTSVLRAVPLNNRVLNHVPIAETAHRTKQST